MPEVLEVEIYRRAAMAVIGRRVIAVRDADPIVVDPVGGFGSLVGAEVCGVNRHGKVLALVLRTAADAGPRVVHLHFGMTGRLIVDRIPALDSLVYGASDDRKWERFALDFESGSLVLSDPRRFSRVRWGEARPSSDLGPDVFDIAVQDFIGRLVSTPRRALKAALLDQHVVAGLGNMLVDEILFRSGIDPRNTVGVLEERALVNLHGEMDRALPEMLATGGSHTGILAHTLRRPGSVCPRDGTALERYAVAGRTTFSCPTHQVRIPVLDAVRNCPR